MARVSRNLLNSTITAGAFVLALAALIILVTSIEATRDASQQSLNSLSHSAAQIEREAHQLADFIDRYGDGDPGITKKDVVTRFDILWSRVFSQEAMINVDIDPELKRQTMETVELGRSLLHDIEKDVLALSPDQTELIAELKEKLRIYSIPAHQLELLAMDDLVEMRSNQSEKQLRNMYLSIALLGGLAAFGLSSIYLLRSDRNAVGRLNAQLEYRVRKRTADLEAVNTRLASEIAQRKCDQAIMVEREARLAQAAQLAKLGYYVWNFEELRFEVCSDAHAAAHGLSRAEFMALTTKGQFLMDDTHPDDLDRRRKKYAELESGLPIELDYRVVTPNGVRRLRESARPIFDDKGLVVRGVGSTLDLTEQYETEMKLFEAQRMDSIGKMTGGVAHDFNNLLAVILGNLELIREHPEIEDRDEMIGDAIRATLRGRDLTMSMLSFARRAPMDPSKLDLNAVISELQSMLRRTLPITIDLKTELGDDIWPIMADRSLTESAVLNLAINAMDAMPSGGTLTIRTENVILDVKEAALIIGDLEPGSYVKMSVRDTGNGIEANLIENIFEPFFTTKSITKNSGLGLSMVQGFIQQTGGGIRTVSSPQQGALFELYFRFGVGSEADVQAVPSEAAPEQAPKPLRVLLVEDDDNVRKVLARQMEQTGMTVVSAGESTSAEIAFAAEGPFDIVVSDIVMPGELQGPALVRRLRETDDTLPAVFLSGYPREIAIYGDGVSVDDVMLMKPVERDDLLVAIDCAMNPGRNLIKDLTLV